MQELIDELRSLEEIEEGFLKTAVYDAFRLATNKYTADGLIGNREVFEVEVRRLLEGQLLKEGFVINQFTKNKRHSTNRILHIRFYQLLH